ncbi:heme biosynthesis protein HemY [Methylobrevis albus]|uniref:Heme biosynthesis protein HemY n=1 Tax=Methylobrevis albus TaxID=2793297 RepID=A0A931MZM8_9HYPH|nr:heme biosynthesis HemY N-terminal domain-containing protein [Methylobrevis albus]MBH0237911.1 heme biosynthesis protein HemY [Methylobrevis albus]
MIRVLIAIAVLFAAVLALDWLGGVPLAVTVAWPGGEIAPSARVVVVALVLFALAAVLAWAILSGVLRSPKIVGDYFRARRRDRGYAALSRGMIAVGAGDARLAHRYAGEARKLLGGREPLVHLLDAQAAQIEGADDRARAAFNRMLDNPETALLGLRGLYIEASRAGEADAARHYAAEAMKVAPGIPWAGQATIEFQSAEEDWEGALATLEQSASSRLVDKREARRQRAVLLTARALQCEDSEPEKARTNALEAHRLAPELVPAAVAAGRLLSRFGDLRKASKVLEAAWKQSPHPDIAEVYAHVRPGDAPRDRLKRAKSLAALRPNSIEGLVAVARQAIDAHEWAEARDALTRALRLAPTRRVCLMLAELEEAEHGDRGRMREWLSRAVTAAPDATWIADGVASDEWAPVSPVTGRLDAYEWKVPATRGDGTSLDGADLADRAMLPLEPPRAAMPPLEDADDRADPPSGSGMGPSSGPGSGTGDGGGLGKGPRPGNGTGGGSAIGKPADVAADDTPRPGAMPPGAPAPLPAAAATAAAATVPATAALAAPAPMTAAMAAPGPARPEPAARPQATTQASRPAPRPAQSAVLTASADLPTQRRPDDPGPLAADDDFTPARSAPAYS